MIKIRYKKMDNVIVLKCVEGSYEELSKIKIEGLKGLGGFTIQETLSYLINTKIDGFVAYNFRSKEECNMFKDTLKYEIKNINYGEDGMIKMKYLLSTKE